MKFQSIALMIQHTFKILKTIKSPTACFTVRIIRGKLPYVYYSNLHEGETLIIQLITLSQIFINLSS